MRAREPDERGDVDSGGVRIAWERSGDAGPWVLFVPTWHIVHSRASKMQVAHLARRFRVLTYDPGGNGGSDRPASGYRIEATAAESLAPLMLKRLRAEVRYAAIEPGAAARVADEIAALLTERKGRPCGRTHNRQEVRDALHLA